ncbi:TPA: hypothetical protein JF904_002927 [Legionella pneumophila]|uniref:Uncharacterized protein n=1 Tax=Legionella pneumophila TaxID=446 RepID=A0AAP3MAX3_LEGPN|nr:hypothetical protein [Legionella pneumophila]HAT9433912.1 hypothetical protein [Legionella pneumophila subsp. pneumophila]ADG25708.1 hypothetical protein lpa_03385 [Legionella pneumophila 2300/99 Alcoy]MCZ4691555.1 hypothetical protein [Legionella pneumophila]MCZ4711071.1 hypothetical protein [Legionella pneumophila]MCZ4718693.1 hypothetical protein [Legionella pneumophila]
MKSFIFLLIMIFSLDIYAIPSQAEINEYKNKEYQVCENQCYADRESCFAQSRSFARNQAEWQSMDIACFKQRNACSERCKLILSQPY